MALTNKLTLRHGQALAMTPQLRQAIKLLELSNLELAGYLEQELERNPLLQRAEPGAGSGAGISGRAAGSAFHGGGSGHAPGGVDSGFAGRRTLHDHLTGQLQLAVRDPAGRMIGAHLIDLVDDAGYFTGDVADVADRLGTDRDSVEAALRIVQGFEPTGVGARDLAECLRLQLAERGRLGPAMDALLSRLDLLARHDIAALARLCGVDAGRVSAMIAEIRRLDPKPGLRFGAEPAPPVVPDVLVRRRPDGAWRVELNAAVLPRVLVNAQYHAEVSAAATSREARLYIGECLAGANWLVRSLARRAATILKVSSEIVRRQEAFLSHGAQYLRPLNLRTVADAVGLHESTVSRVTAGKYMAAPRGVYELKFFFAAAVAAAGGGPAHSAAAVRHRIKALIEAEKGESVLSDGRITALLNAAGVNVARRTVAKYRHALGIPSSVVRRRRKRISA